MFLFQPMRCLFVNYEIHPNKQETVKMNFKIFPLEHLAAFRAFLQSEFSDENIEFWLECEEFKSTSPDELRWKAEDIYERFIQPTASREVSLIGLMVDGGNRH